MTLQAKPVLKDKFWIVERDGEKIGTIQAAPDGVVYVDRANRTKFPSIRILSSTYGVHVDKPQRRVRATPAGNVYGFPVDVARAHNALYNVIRRVPVYTKTAKSKSMFCAGYYLVQTDGRWTEMFCPKLITINRYPFCGPFYSLEELRETVKGDSDVRL